MNLTLKGAPTDVLIITMVSNIGKEAEGKEPLTYHRKNETDDELVTFLRREYCSGCSVRAQTNVEKDSTAETSKKAANPK